VPLINVKIDDELYEDVRRKSNETGVSVSFYVRAALKQWVCGVENDRPQRDAKDLSYDYGDTGGA